MMVLLPMEFRYQYEELTTQKLLAEKHTEVVGRKIRQEVPII